MKKKRAVKVMLIVLLILALVLSAGYLYLYNHGLSDGQASGPAEFDIQPLVVTEIAQLVQDVATERGYTLIDINTLTADHPEWFATDGVHPNNDGAAALGIGKEINLQIKKTIVRELTRELSEA